jgi:hypothetical protein
VGLSRDNSAAILSCSAVRIAEAPIDPGRMNLGSIHLTGAFRVRFRQSVASGASEAGSSAEKPANMTARWCIA